MSNTTAPAFRRPAQLPLRYRIGWRLNYIALSAYGPAELGGAGQPDPRRRMRQERADRVAALAPRARRRAITSKGLRGTDAVQGFIAH